MFALEDFFFNALPKQPSVLSVEGVNMDKLNVVMDVCNCNACEAEAGGFQGV